MRMLKDDRRISAFQEYATTASLHTFPGTSLMGLNRKDGHPVAVTTTLWKQLGEGKIDLGS